MIFERLDRGRIAGGLLAEVRRDRVARDEFGEHERDECDPEQEQDQGGNAAQNELEEASGETAAAP